LPASKYGSPMTAHLEVLTSARLDIQVLSGERLTVGREGSNNLVLDDADVSRSHAVFQHLGAVWVVRDLSSRNGTMVNGERIAGDRPLRSGDEVRVGTTRIVYRSDTADPLAPTEGAEAPPPLTPRERDVLLELFRPSATPGLFTEPASTRDIAAALVISEAAVKQHLTNLYDKFGIHSGLDRRRIRLANEVLRRGAVALADVRARPTR
jgi:predicted component of type VI protein secretion system